MDKHQWVGLAEAIAGIRSELQQAMRAGEGTDLRFVIDDIEMEFNVEIAKSLDGDGKVKVWVVEAGAKGTLSRTASQRLTVTMKPADDPLISAVDAHDFGNSR